MFKAEVTKKKKNHPITVNDSRFKAG